MSRTISPPTATACCPAPAGDRERNPVAGDHEIDDFLVALAVLDHAAYFAAQILRQFGVGIGDVLVLTDQAAQFLGQSSSRFSATGSAASAASVALEARAERCVQYQANGQCGDQSLHLFSSASNGMIFLARISGVTGPVCFMRMTPALSMT